MSGDKTPIVIDNGSHTIKAGFSGDDAPRAVFRPITATRKNQANIQFSGAHVGDEAVQHLNGYYRISKPLQGNEVSSWDDMVCHHMKVT